MNFFKHALSLPQRLSPNQKLVAILCSLGSASLFSCTHVIVKYVSTDLHAYHIAFWNDVFALIAILFFSRQLGGVKKTLQSQNKLLHSLRAICLTMGYLLLIVSLTKMPIADAYSLFFTAPILGIIGAAYFLKEHVRRYHIIALFMGFAGVLFILRPGFISLDTALFYPLAAASFFAASMVFGRQIPDTETKFSFGLYPVLMTLIVTGVLVTADFKIPNIESLFLLATSGFMAGFAVLLAGLAYAKASAAIVAPFEYIQMVWGVMFGYFIFHDVLTLPLSIGAGLIILSGLYLVHHAQK